MAVDSMPEWSIEGLPADLIQIATAASFREHVSVTAWIAKAIRAASQPKEVVRYEAYKIVDAAQAELYRFLMESGWEERAAFDSAKDLVAVGIYLRTEHLRATGFLRNKSRLVESRH